jgi:predicted nucleic acid-binding protein
MLLFIALVLGMFGYYFDVYEMLLGSVRENEPLLSVGEFAYTRSAMERIARPVEITSRTYSNSDFNLPRTAGELAQLYNFLPPRAGSRAVVAWWRERLKSQGMTDADLLEVEALGHDREAYGETMARVLALIRDQDFETAANLLEDALRASDPRNLLVQQDLLLRLVEAYHLAGRKPDAGRAASQLSEVAEKLLNIRSRALNDAELGRAAVAVAAERDAPEASLDDAAKTEMKMRLLKAFDEGKLSRAEMDAILAELK